MSTGATDNAEKAVKMLVENHRLALTLVGLFVAGLFAYAGRSSSVLEWRYFVAQGCFIVSGILVLMSVSVAIDQAKSGQYNASDPYITRPYMGAGVLILIGLILTAWFLLFPAGAGPSLAPITGIQIDASGARIGPDSKLRVDIQFDSSGTKIQKMEINPP
jgi:hypothetical protein